MRFLKTIILTFLILLIFSNSYGFMKQRQEWWRSNIKNLEKDKVLIKKMNMDKSVIKLIEEEIESSNEVLKIFTKESNIAGSLSNNAVRYSRDDILKYISETAGPVLSLHSLNYITLNYKNDVFTEQAKNIVHDYVQWLNKNSGISIDDLLLISNKEDISKEDWENLTMELLMGTLISRIELIRNKVFGGIYSAVEPQVKGDNFELTEPQLYEIIKTGSVGYIESFDYAKELPLTPGALERSWMWEKIFQKVDRRITHFKKLNPILKDTNIETSIKKISYYYRYPGKLEKELFDVLKDQYIASLKKDIQKMQYEYRRKNKSSFDEAVLPDIQKYFEKIDDIRKGVNVDSLGSGKEKFFMHLGKRFDDVFKEYSKVLRLSLKKSGVKYIKQKGKVEISGNRFLIEYARKSKSFVNIYRKKSIDYLDWIYCLNNVDKDGILTTYDNRLNRNAEYLNFIKSSAGEVKNISGIPYVNQIFSGLTGRIGDVYKMMTSSMTIERRFVPYMDTSIVNRIRNKKTSLIDQIKDVKMSVYTDYKIYKKKSAYNKRVKKVKSRNVSEKMAQYEADTLYDILSSQISIFNELKYTEEAFALYLLKLDKIKQDAESGVFSKDLERITETGSIMPLVNDFDSDKIVREYKTRTFLRKRIEAGMAKLLTLLNYYKGRGFVLDSQLDTKKIRDLRKILKKYISVSAVKWRMTEVNFGSVDRNVVKYLTKTYNKKSWMKKNGKEEGNRKSVQSLSYKDEAFSIVLPDSFKESSLSAYEKERDIIKSFKSLDGKAVVYIVKISSDGKDVKEISDSWLEKMGNNLVKMKWGEKENKKYYWSISKDKKKSKNIMEAYAVLKGGNTFIISGITSRERYKFFKPKLESVFNSAVQ